MAERLAAGGAAQRKDVASLTDSDRASLGSRAFAYLLDSAVLFAFTMLFALASFLNIFLRSDSGRQDPSDAAIWHSVLILVLTVPAWLYVNLMLSRRRGQTIGQYVAGLRMVRDNGQPAGGLRLLCYWLLLHPVLFHPLLAVFWLLLAYTSLSLSESRLVVLLAVSIAILCLLSPFANFFFALSDPQRRTLHDRLAGMKLVRLP